MSSGMKIGLYGPNGCGKSTFFRIITGLLKPQQGRIFLQGHPLSQEKDFRSLRMRVGLVLQNADDQLFCPTVLEDVAFGPLNMGFNKEKARRISLETLAQLGLSGYENRLIHTLSGGEKKLVALATVLAMQPEALLLDETNNDLDPEARERLINLLNELPVARIVISHDWDFLSRTSSQFMTIENGKLILNPSLSRHRYG